MKRNRHWIVWSVSKNGRLGPCWTEREDMPECPRQRDERTREPEVCEPEVQPPTSPSRPHEE
jgi:hypothetical protein